jgi:hypothetical protein
MYVHDVCYNMRMDARMRVRAWSMCLEARPRTTTHSHAPTRIWYAFMSTSTAVDRMLLTGVQLGGKVQREHRRVEHGVRDGLGFGMLLRPWRAMRRGAL